MRKLLIILLIMIVSTACQGPVNPPQAKPGKPNQTTEEPGSKKVNNLSEEQTLVLPDQLSKVLENTPLTLTLQKESTTSKLLARLTNNTDQTIENIKINVTYTSDNADRILYYGQAILPGQTSESFRILGPSSNTSQDIIVKDVTIKFTDGEELTYSNDQQALEKKPVQPTNREQRTGEKKRAYTFYQFGNLLIEANDLDVSLEIQEDTLVATINNKSDYTLLSLSLDVFDGKETIHLASHEALAKGQTINITQQLQQAYENLDTFTIQSMVIEADYDDTSLIKTEFHLSGDITARYELNMK